MKFSVKLKRGIIVSALCLLPWNVTFAQQGSDAIVKAINDARDLINQTLQTIFVEVNKTRLRIDENYDQEHVGFDETAGKNIEEGQISAGVSSSSANLNNQWIESALGPNTLKNATSLLSSIIAGDSYNPDLDSTNRRRAERAEGALRCGSFNLNMDSLIGPNAYETKMLDCDANSDARKPWNQADFARNYILFVSNLADPYPDASVSSLKRRGLIKSDDEAAAQRVVSSSAYRSYLTAQRSVMASQSAATSVLYYLYQLRQATVDTQGKKTAPSALETQTQMATRRINNPEWYEQMKAALPTVLNREAVLILAEIQNQLHLMRVENQYRMGLEAANLLKDMTQTKQLLKMKANSVETAASRAKSVEDQ